MIQRIQTLYLLALSVAIALMLFFPLAEFLGGVEQFTLSGFGVKSAGGSEIIISTLYMGILLIVCAVLPFVTIFLYKYRWLQLRLCIVEIVLLVGAQLFVCYYIYRSYHSISGFELHSISYSVVDVLPVVGILLAWLATRGIMRDQALIRSLNRIR